METKIQCPICFTDRMCFDEYVEKDNYHSYLCFRCGFTSNSNYAFGKEEIKLALESSPKLVKELSFRDYKRYVVWIPSVVNMGDKGIIFPEGTKEDWNWRYAKVVEIPEGERRNTRDINIDWMLKMPLFIINMNLLKHVEKWEL